ncbi:hypothetical protein GCM10010228_07580 [Streptomyces massasporeus]|nr:hypothetical protein GCM10010228_07580 [Streptomyces massasporeus]
MTAQSARPERSGPETASVMDVPPFKPPLVKAVFRDVTPMHVSRSAARAGASVTRTVLTEIIDGARRAAAEESRKGWFPGTFSRRSTGTSSLRSGVSGTTTARRFRARPVMRHGAFVVFGAFTEPP